MTTAELMKFIGQTATYTPDLGIAFRVRITDVKQSYGHIRLLIEPVNGSGARWVQLSALDLED